MFPATRQRWILLATTLLGGVLFLYAGRAGMASADLGGYTLLFSTYPGLALTWLVLLGLPVLGLALLASAAGNPLAGVFVLSASLIVPAVEGGPITPWLHGHRLPGSYWQLCMELVIWAVFMLLALAVIHHLREPVRRYLPASWRTEPVGGAIPVKAPGVNDWMAGLLTAVVGGAVAFFFLQSPDPVQVAAGLVIGFCIAALIAAHLFSDANPILILLSPLVVGAGSYAWVATSYEAMPTVLQALYVGKLMHTALALPVFFASAGVAGAAIGVGWAQVTLAGQEEDEAAESSAPAPAAE